MSKFNKILLFVNVVIIIVIVIVIVAKAWTNPPGNPTSGGGALSYSGGNISINASTTIAGNFTVSGSASNTCTKVAYSYPGTVSCPQYYYVTTISNPTVTGDMICCKVNNPS